jgi:hypothetical protein
MMWRMAARAQDQALAYPENLIGQAVSHFRLVEKIGAAHTTPEEDELIHGCLPSVGL